MQHINYIYLCVKLGINLKICVYWVKALQDSLSNRPCPLRYSYDDHSMKRVYWY